MDYTTKKGYRNKPRKLLNLECVKRDFKKTGCRLLATEYKNAHTKMPYICSCGNRSETTWANYSRGHRCKKCGDARAHDKQRLDYEYVKSCFEKRGYTLLTTNYKNNRVKLEYICDKGHLSTILFGHLQQGHGCAICAGISRHSHEYVQRYFTEYGYELLDKYVSADDPIRYRCPEGHITNATFNTFQQGKRCRRCFIEYQRGENHPNWKSDISLEERMARRNYIEYREWRELVYNRDNYTCQVCSSRGGITINAHHLFSFNENELLRTELDNGVTLCEECHNMFHGFYGYRGNTKAQFDEFKELFAVGALNASNTAQ